MQNEIQATLPLLDSQGHITEEGWARHPYWQYDRKSIHAPRWKIKEWDYFSILSAQGNYGVTITFSDLGYIGLMAICFLDFEKGVCTQAEELVAFPSGKMGLTANSDQGKMTFIGKKVSIDYHYLNGQRHIKIEAPFLKNGEGHQGLKGEFVLTQAVHLESINIATSWKENRKAFYYNRKINCMPVAGHMTIGQKEYPFFKENDFGALDWGRGVWTYKNRWFWGSASGYIDGKAFGFNIGYGFSDRSPASENVLFYEGVAHKLAEITFHFNESDYLQPWTFTSSDGRLEMNFTPAIDRKAKLNLGLIKTDQHQVFGYFNGVAILDDGSKLQIHRLAGFAEDVLNWW